MDNMDNIDSFRKQLKYITENALTGKIDMQYCQTEFNKMLSDYMTRLIPIAENYEKLPNNYLKTKINHISAVDTLDINGRVFRSNNAYNIEVYIGLMIFIHKFFKIFVSQTGTTMHVGDNIKLEEPSLNFDYIVPITKAMLKAFWENRLFFEQSWIGAQQLSDGEIDLLSQLLACAEMFIIAHEIAHIIQRCNPSTQKYSLLPDHSKVLLNWSKEIDADILGLLFCILSNSERASLCFNSIELFFIVQKMLVDYYTMEKGTKPKLSETHPPAAIRLRAIREFVKDMKPADNWFVVGEQWEKIGDYVLETIFPNTSE